MPTPRSLVAVACVAVGAAVVLDAQITQPDSGAGREARPHASRSGTSRGCRIRAGLRPADQDVTPAGWARVSFVRDLAGRPPLRQRLARLPVPARRQQPAVGLRRRRARCSRSRSTTGSRAASSASTFTRSSRGTACSTPCTASARRAIPRRPNFIPPGYDAGRRDLSQRHHRVARHQSRRRTRSTGTRRELLRVAHVVANLDAIPMGAVEFNPTAQARRRRLRPALHERQRSRASATAAGRTPTIPPDAAARLGDRRRSCASIRAARR